MQPVKVRSGFRDDINGLRAWAVIAVLLFHFKVPGFAAGFIGVDIFFVISGFLMTGIILRGLEKNNFSLWQFYMARGRRIVPALMVLIVTLLALGWFWLPTPDYRALGEESFYSLAFLSNVHYWRSAGYFDTAAHEKWLLHTWSLGIEMQFYLLYPVFALLVWKLRAGAKTFAWSLVLVFMLSLGWSLFISSSKPTAAFYLLPTRGWELAMGGLVFLLGRKPRGWLEGKGLPLYAAGLLLWLIGFILIDNHMPWPSGWAIFPALGTALIILAQQESSRLMVNPLAQWLGNISYSLYLWHWPLVVILYFADLQQQWGWVIAGLLLSMLLGQLSYQLIENPVRRGLTSVRMSRQVLALGLAGLTLGMTAASVRLMVFEGRLPDAVERASAETRNLDPRRKECFEQATEKGSPGCIYGADEVGAILLGDSHAGSTITALGVAAEAHGTGTLLYGMHSCPTLDGAVATGPNPLACRTFNEWAFAKMTAHPGIPLVLVSRTAAYLMGPNEPDLAHEVPNIDVLFGKRYESRLDPEYIREFQDVLTSTACRLAEERPVFLMRPVPEFGTNIYRTLTLNHYRGVDAGDVRMPITEYHERNRYVWAAQDEAARKCGVKILDPTPYLCDEEYCYGSRDGRPLYYDDDHLNEYGNRFLVPMFAEVFASRASGPAEHLQQADHFPSGQAVGQITGQ